MNFILKHTTNVVIQVASISSCITYLMAEQFNYVLLSKSILAICLALSSVIYYLANRHIIAIGWVDFKGKYTTMLFLLGYSIFYNPIYSINTSERFNLIITMNLILALIIRLFYKPFNKPIQK